jgi:hypothetical protein
MLELKKENNIYWCHYTGRDYSKIIQDLQKYENYSRQPLTDNEDDDWYSNGLTSKEFINKFENNFCDNKEINKINYELQKFSSKLTKKTRKKHFVGDNIIIPRAILNHPKAFVYNATDKKKSLNIFIAINVLAFTSSTDQREFMLKMLKLITAFSKNYDLRITLGKVSETKGNGKIAIESFILKDYSHYFNLSRLWFPMSNTGTYRRILFEMLEKHMALEEEITGFSSGYGATISGNKSVKEAVSYFENYDHVFNYYSMYDLTDEEIIEKYCN